MKITVEMILAKNPCNYDEKKLRKLLGKGKSPLAAMNIKDVPDLDKIWAATNFLPDKINREFAIWCARQCKTDIKEITNYIDVIERYYAGNATEKELRAANWAANRAADWAANRAANWAAKWAVKWVVDRAANWAAYMAAYMAADRAADRAAYWAAGGAAETKKKQVAKLKKLIKQALKEQKGKR